MKEYKGLSNEEVISSREKFGKNLLTPPPSTPWWKMYLEKFKDPIVSILLVAAVISLIVAFVEGGWTESIGIIVAILLATGAGFKMEWDAKKKFDAMKSFSDEDLVKVIRNSSVTEVPKSELVVDDIVLLSPGDELPADIKVLESIDLKVDESTMTGESKPVSKKAPDNNELWNGSGFPYYLLLRSTKITEGSGVGIVVAVGDSTEIGKTTRQAMEESEIETPLNKQLNGLADVINKAAFTIAGLLFLFLNIHHFFFTEFDPAFMEIFKCEVKFIMAAVVLIVVAVPEGLPLSTTLALAFSMKTMAKENNLVKKMHACETIGAVRIIFTDKTGTLTQNKMSVVDSDIVNEDLIVINACCNSTANISEDGKIIGNPTEGAILNSIGKVVGSGCDYRAQRNYYEVREQIPFNSTNKYMMTKVADPDSKPKRGALPDLVLVKGAPEVVSKMINDDSYLEKVSEQQARGRRAISFASGSDMDNLKYDGTLFIEDPIRTDVPDAVKKCYGAGVDVVMMTGDNVKTAAEIARQAGFSRRLQGEGIVSHLPILNVDPESLKYYDESKDSKVWAVEAKDFDDMAWGDPQSGYPNVIARCKPEDKLRIMKKFQELGYVCAMTGDGVNDSPSLNHSDVGIAMGSGTSVAKEAADIVLLDDAFPSIVTGMKWGRSLYKNIQSFLYFQLTINVAACLIALFGPVLGVDMPFTVTQFLWVNLVMDTLAALCLASEPADPIVLLDKPRKSGEFILNKLLKKSILGLGLTMFVIMSLVILDIKNGSTWFHLDKTEFFAIFMTINWWNLFNARVIGKNRSVFHDLFKNSKFVIGSLVILAGTILIVQIGGDVFETRPLSFNEWVIIILASSPIMIVREIWFRLFNKNQNK